jgi:NAD(P)H-nitrite reductase large subunit
VHKDYVICRCENVKFKEIYDELAAYNCSSREVKLRTRAGMGFCGGRTCRPLIAQITEQFNEKPITDDLPLKFRPPVRPVTFDILGGD